MENIHLCNKEKYKRYIGDAITGGGGPLEHYFTMDWTSIVQVLVKNDKNVRNRLILLVNSYEKSNMRGFFGFALDVCKKINENTI